MKDYQELYGKGQDRGEAAQNGFERLGSAPAVAALGLLARAACLLFSWTPPSMARYAALATVPAALLLLVLNWLRLPMAKKFSLRALGAIGVTLVLAAASLYLWGVLRLSP